jgi:hypothetical protein
VHNVLSGNASAPHTAKPDDSYNLIGSNWPEEDPIAYLDAVRELWNRGGDAEAAASVLCLVAGHAIQARIIIAGFCVDGTRQVTDNPDEPRYAGVWREWIASVYFDYRRDIKKSGEFSHVVDPHHPCT